MDLKSIIPKKEKKSSYYWSLSIEADWVQAAAWTIKDEKAEVVSVSPATAWKGDAELISSTDTALSAAVSGLPDEAGEPSKTVFGVSYSWIKEGKIEPQYLEKLKNLCSELSLTPTGFVILPEAIAHLIRSEEGTPLSAVVVGIGEENLEISIFRMGKMMGNSLVARSVSVMDDVEEGLARFSVDEPYPSRIILYDGKEGELEDTKQELLKVSWGDLEKIKFLHTPKVEIFSPERKVMAVSLAGASEVAGVKNLKERKELEEEENDFEMKEEGDKTGFLVGEDVSKKEEEISLPREESPQFPEASKESTLEQKESPLKGLGQKLKLTTLSIFAKVPSVRMKEKLGKKGPLALIGGGIAVILVTLFLLWWFTPKATVTIYIAPRKLSEDLDIKVDTKTQKSDAAKKLIAGKILTTNEEGEKTISTTGRKTVGEKASGTVEIRNGTASEIDLPANTKLLSGELEFTLASSVTVPEATSPNSPGTVTTEVIASDIGAEYNLGENTSFSVSNYPKAEVDATSTSTFSGGSSREIAAVSEEDRESLLEDLTNELTNKAKSSLSLEITSEEILIEDTVIALSSSRDFSNIVGDETETLKLSLTLEVQGVSIGKKDIFSLVEGSLKDDIPEGYVLRESQVDMEFDLEDEDEGVYELTTDLKANLLPEINTTEIANKISGKKVSVAQSFLNTIPGFSRAEINQSPKLFPFLTTLPHVKSKIEVEIAAER